MATMVTGEELRQAVKGQIFIKGGDPEAVEGVKYDFHLGSKILMAGGSPIDTNQLSELEKSKLQILRGLFIARALQFFVYSLQADAWQEGGGSNISSA